MKTVRVLFVLGVLALAAGCGAGGDGGPTGPPPGGLSETEPNDFTAQPLDTLSSADIVIGGAMSTGADVDLYSVLATEPVNMLVSLDWSGSNDLELTISNSNGVFVRNVDTAGHPEACTLGNLPAGTYTVRVASFSNNGNSYVLTIGKR